MKKNVVFLCRQTITTPKYLILMNYDYTKKYGELVKEMANEFNKGRDIYEAASALTKYAELNFAYSRYAYRELYDKFYPEKQETVTFVIDKYVMSDAVATAFLENLYADYKEENRFIERNIGDAHSLLRQIQSILQGMSITSHPEDGSEELYNFAINDIIKPIVKQAYEEEDYIESILRSHESKAVQGANSEKVEKTIEQEKNERIAKPVELTQQNTKPILYEIKDYQQCSRVFDYLQKTSVLDDRTKQIEFLTAITQADMSNITPNLVTKFRCAVARLKWAVKGDADEWARAACGSIGKTPSQALAGATNNAGWFDDLCEILPDQPINK